MASKLASQGAREVYRGYMPIGLPQHRPKQRVKPWWKVEGRPRVTLYPKKEIEGYSEEPEYPPLNDGSRIGIKTQVRLDWYEKLKSLPTVEQKLHEVVSQTTHMTALMSNWLPNYNSLPTIEYITQTKLVNRLPDSYQIKADSESDSAQSSEYQAHVAKLVDILLNQIEVDRYNSIKGEYRFQSKPDRSLVNNYIITHQNVQNIVNAAKKYLGSTTNSQLLEYQFDLSPSIRSWWFHSGLPPPNNKPFFWSRKDDEGNINQLIQVNGSTALNIRSSNFIPPILASTDPLITDTSIVPKCPHNLRLHGVRFAFKRPVTLPGFWYHSDTSNDYPHTCFLTLDCLKQRKLRNYKLNVLGDDTEACLNGQAILSGFSWLNSLAMHHGYTPYQELDYPFTCQVISTDGQNWMFNVYQLNGHTFHRDLGRARVNNVCWSSGLMKLYECYEDGQFKGVNDEVVKHLFSFLNRQTSIDYTSALNLKPFLGEDMRDEEEKEKMRGRVRKHFEQRENVWLKHEWRVPLFEHIFFRSKTFRRQIKDMKPQWHIPKPPISRYFD